MGYIAVGSENDHNGSLDCWCEPVVEEFEDGQTLILHDTKEANAEYRRLKAERRER